MRSPRPRAGVSSQDCGLLGLPDLPGPKSFPLGIPPGSPISAPSSTALLPTWVQWTTWLSKGLGVGWGRSPTHLAVEVGGGAVTRDGGQL
jgi:hypothetical protein